MIHVLHRGHCIGAFGEPELILLFAVVDIST
jgi:hypothetical protein